MDSFNKLTPAEAERLALLAEEAAEVIHVVGKILRHGYASCHPNGGMNNRWLLEKEVGDFECVKTLMMENNDICNEEVVGFSHSKRHTINKYLHHNVVGRKA